MDEVDERRRVLKEAHPAFAKTQSVADALRCQSVMIAVQCQDLAELGQIVALIERRLQAVEAYLEQATSSRPSPTN